VQLWQQKTKNDALVLSHACFPNDILARSHKYGNRRDATRHGSLSGAKKTYVRRYHMASQPGLKTPGIGTGRNHKTREMSLIEFPWSFVVSM